jgi:hypothetical protein
VAGCPGSIRRLVSGRSWNPEVGAFARAIGARAWARRERVRRGLKQSLAFAVADLGAHPPLLPTDLPSPRAAPSAPHADPSADGPAPRKRGRTKIIRRPGSLARDGSGIACHPHSRTRAMEMRKTVSDCIAASLRNEPRATSPSKCLRKAFATKDRAVFRSSRKLAKLY